MTRPRSQEDQMDRPTNREYAESYGRHCKKALATLSMLLTKKQLRSVECSPSNNDPSRSAWLVAKLAAHYGNLALDGK